MGRCVNLLWFHKVSTQLIITNSSLGEMYGRHVAIERANDLLNDIGIMKEPRFSLHKLLQVNGC